MQIPKFWAQVKAAATVPQTGRSGGNRAKKPRMLQRFGWSDLSQDAAEQHANARLAAAIEQAQVHGVLERGETMGPGVAPLERIAPYGQDGIPIREEIIAEHPHATLTRNRYGAICLNTANVLFADVDVPHFSESTTITYLVLLLAIPLIYYQYIWHTLALLPLLLILYFWNQTLARKHMANIRLELLDAMRCVANRNNELLLRVYETPNGYRVLALHALFDPAAEATTALLTALSCDPHYRHMCLIQQCFRARVSAKPWRTAMTNPRAPHRIAVWPLPEEKVAMRRIWVQEYERAAQGFAACRYLETLGRGTPNDVAMDVCTLHDAQSNANSMMPLA